MADWLYAEAGNLALPDPKLCEKLRCEALHPAAIVFQSNAVRIRAFWGLYPHLVEQASVNVIRTVETVFALTGKPLLSEEQAKDPVLKQKITDEIMRRIKQRFQESGGSVEYATGYSFTRAVKSFGDLINTQPDMAEGVYAAFSAQLTSAWTAVETLVSDLWEAVLNDHPKYLAGLVGHSRRISKIAGSSSRDRLETHREISNEKEEFEPKLRDFDRITYGTYDASELMGTLLREQFKFQTLAGIRRAYSAAFAKDCDQIDAALADSGLDRLNLVRNVLLHKAGVVDATFIDAASSLQWDSVWGAQSIVPEEEKPLLLTGSAVKNLINPVFQCSEKLLIAVDSWLLRN
jgi:hypothetical protein